MPAVIGKIVPGRTDREGGSAAGSPLRQGRLVRPGAPANPRRAAPVIASRVRFLESNVGGTTEAMLSSQCGTEAYFFVLHLPLGRGGKDERNPSVRLCRTAPPCGARKTLRAHAIPCVFRPLRKFRLCFICHRQRKAAIPLRQGSPKGKRTPPPQCEHWGTSP